MGRSSGSTQKRPRKNISVSRDTYQLLLHERRRLEAAVGLSIGWSDFLNKSFRELIGLRKPGSDA